MKANEKDYVVMGSAEEKRRLTRFNMHIKEIIERHGGKVIDMSLPAEYSIETQNEIRKLRQTIKKEISKVFPRKNSLNGPTRKELLNVIMQTKDVRLCVTLATVFLTGLRCSELAGLRWRDINFKEKKILIKRKKCIAGYCKERQIPLTLPLAEILRSWSKVTDIMGYYCDFAELCRKHNLTNKVMPFRSPKTLLCKMHELHPKLSYRVLRQMFIMRLLQNGVPIEQIKKLIGWSNDRYMGSWIVDDTKGRPMLEINGD